jgi:LDH2 family malate/lactate/ureidoglycolate dehydrogenase
VTVRAAAAVVPHQDLRALAAAALVRAGVAADHAALIADSAVESDLGGRTSHGVLRIAGYLAKAREGGIDLRAEPLVLHDNGTVFALDARNGFGQLALRLAIDMAVERSRARGIACGTIRNLNNAGALGYFARLATSAGQIAIVAGNATPAMPPHGGRTPVLGTNPLCIAVPAPGGAAPVLDMATTAASKGTIRLAARKGQRIPADWALTAEGEPTTDAAAALEGLLLPFGGAKGFGIALMVEILSGVLSGSGVSGEVRPLADTASPSNAGGFVVTISPDAFMPRAEFDRRLGALLEAIRGSTPAPGFERVMVPGDRYWRDRERRVRDGVEIPAEVHRELLALAGRAP